MDRCFRTGDDLFRASSPVRFLAAVDFLLEVFFMPAVFALRAPLSVAKVAGAEPVFKFFATVLISNELILCKWILANDCIRPNASLRLSRCDTSSFAGS